MYTRGRVDEILALGGPFFHLLVSLALHTLGLF